MKAIILSTENPLLDAVTKELTANSIETAVSATRAILPGQNFDLCIDMSARSIPDVKQVIAALENTRTHYVFLSTYQVYPPVSNRLAPWRTEDIDLCDDTGLGTFENNIRRVRAVERELKHLGSRAVPWTILRSSVVELKESSGEDGLWWFVSRVLDGGPVILPDHDDPLFRHVTEKDLAKAIAAIAGKKEAYLETIHVTSHALYSFESYARMVMKGLGKEVPIVRVSDKKWHANNLNLPFGENVNSAFIEDSLLLERMGWQPMEESEWIQEYSSFLVENPLGKSSQREIELSLTAEKVDDESKHYLTLETNNWRLVGISGDPISFHMDYGSVEKKKDDPLVRTCRITMGTAEARALIEPSLSPGPRLFGHNALVSIVDPKTYTFPPVEFFLPLATRPCGDLSCEVCKDKRVANGPSVEGLGAEFLTLPAQHLVPVPDGLQNVALLADSLACLLTVLPSLFEETDNPVWIFGHHVDVILAVLLAKEANLQVVHVNRWVTRSTLLPADTETMTLNRARRKVREKEMGIPGIVINLSGAEDGENILAGVLSDSGYLISPFVRTQSHKRRFDVRLPLIAPGRMWLESALDQLKVWNQQYELESYLHQLPSDLYKELFVSQPLKLSYLDFMEEVE